MRKWLSAAALACLCAACGGSASTDSAASAGDGKTEVAAAEEKKAPPAPVYKEVTIPAGTTLRLDLKSSVASDSSKMEDTVRAARKLGLTPDDVRAALEKMIPVTTR